MIRQFEIAATTPRGEAREKYLRLGDAQTVLFCSETANRTLLLI